MRKIPAPVPSMAVLFMLCLLILTPCAFGQEAPDLQAGIRHYQAENYEEAIDILTKYRQKDPSSSMAAFFLGMSYKQANDIPSAEGQLRDAATLTPPVRQAPV